MSMHKKKMFTWSYAMKKVFNYLELHFSEGTFFKIHVADNFKLLSNNY